MVIGEIDGFIEEENGSKYLNIALTGNNSEVLKKYAEIWKGIKDLILKINGTVEEYDKDLILMMIYVGVVLKFRILSIVIRCIFEKDSKYYQ